MAKRGRPRRESLTEQEIDIVRLVAKSYTHKEIAELLGVSSAHVAVRIEALERILGFRDIAALTRYAIRSGLVTADQ